MAEEKVFKIVITRPALIHYQETVLVYLFEHFSYERAMEIDEGILSMAATLERNPARGRKEKYLYLRPTNMRIALAHEFIRGRSETSPTSAYIIPYDKPNHKKVPVHMI